LAEARRIIESWRQHYKEHRPHSALAYRTPQEFAALFTTKAAQLMAQNQEQLNGGGTPALNHQELSRSLAEHMGAGHFDQPTSESRRALESARFGMGAITPEEALVMIRPQWRSLIPGSTRSVMAMTERTRA
jgi:hypothetical protein